MVNRIILYLRMIKFSHSVFALPFAFTAVFLAAGGLPSFRKASLIALAMVGGRSAAMGFNRIIDRKIDGKNPRTKNREIPAGKIATADALVFSVLSAGVMVFAAYLLNPLCFALSPVAIMVLIFYSFTKRFTSLSHLVLGIAISGAPLGAWLAITGSFDIRILPLVGGVVFWLAGFDMLYALQDREFDLTHGLHSIPRKFGVGKTLIISRIAHVLSWLLLVVNGFLFHLGYIYFAGTALVGALLVYEHSLVREGDLTRLDIAFFNMNGYISLSVFLFTCADLFIVR